MQTQVTYIKAPALYKSLYSLSIVQCVAELFDASVRERDRILGLLQVMPMTLFSTSVYPRRVSRLPRPA